MRPDYPSRETLRDRLERDLRNISSLLADSQYGGGQVLERLPNGEYAWLRPQLDTAIADADQVDQILTDLLERRPAPQPRPEPEETRFGLTDAGRRALAMERLFGDGWPRLSEVA